MNQDVPQQFLKDFRLLAVAAILGLLAVLTNGCADQDSAVKSTLHDHDHVLPDHWPVDLDDTSSKIRERLVLLDSQGDDTSRRELDDLIAWVPEIAADSDLTESQWLPIYNASEALRSSIRRRGWTAEHIEQTEELCKLIDHAASSLPPAYTLPDAPEHES